MTKKSKPRTYSSFDEWRKACFPEAHKKEQEKKRIEEHGIAHEIIKRIEKKIRKRLNKK